MGYWCTLHLFDDSRFYKEVAPVLKGIAGDLTADYLEFLKFYRTAEILHLSQQEINCLVKDISNKIISISKSLDENFKTNSECQDIVGYKNKMLLLGGLDGYYEFCKFFEYFVFKFCADFFPHLPLGKGGVSRILNLNIKTLSYSIIGELDNWNEFLCGYGMGITNWINHEDIEYLYLDKDNLRFIDNERAEGFLTLLEVAKSNKLGLIIGADMREEILELLPNNKLTKPEDWTRKNKDGLLWSR